MIKVVGAVVVTLPMIAMLAGSADAKCKQWSIDGAFRLKQENSVTTRCTFNQRKNKFEGLCNASSVGGDATGRLERSGRFKMVVRWDNKSVGDYTGFVNDKGKIVDGRAFDRKNPSSFTKWTNLSKLKCANR